MDGGDFGFAFISDAFVERGMLRNRFLCGSAEEEVRRVIRSFRL